jgi:hypothetical protein
VGIEFSDPVVQERIFTLAQIAMAVVWVGLAYCFPKLLGPRGPIPPEMLDEVSAHADELRVMSLSPGELYALAGERGWTGGMKWVCYIDALRKIGINDDDAARGYRLLID